MASKKPIDQPKPKVIYMPPIYDTKRVREGCRVILDCVEARRAEKLKANSEGESRA